MSYQNIYHFYDVEKGRATVRKTWTACGKAVRSCFVFTATVNHITCPECAAVLAQRAELGKRAGAGR